LGTANLEISTYWIWINHYTRFKAKTLFVGPRILLTEIIRDRIFYYILFILVYYYNVFLIINF